MEVHRIVGNGFTHLFYFIFKGIRECFAFQEEIYQRALVKEMKLQGLVFSREHEMQVFYKGDEIGMRRVDFFVGGIIMVELKAVKQLEDVHLAQAINYLEACGLDIGLLINLGNTSLQFKRVMKPNKNHSIPKS